MNRDELLKKICPWGTCDCGNDYESCNCDDCNRVLEEWLYDYEKHVIDQYKANTEIKDTIREIHDNVAREMYCKGVDDFTILMKETLIHDWDTSKIYEQIIYNRLFDECDRIAEQLKEQNK